jgi:transcriptional regulator with XRE-family HTH domain
MSTGISPTLTVIAGGRFTSLSAVNNRQRQIEDLADYLRRVRNEKGMSQRDVEIKSGNRISKGYIGQIENREVLGHSVTPQKLQALAVGLGVSEDEVFAVARGKSLAIPEVFDSEIYVMFRGFDELSDEDKADLLGTIRMLAAEVQRRRPRKTAENGKGSKRGGKK